MKLAARAILKIDRLRHDCCANLIALQTLCLCLSQSQSFQLLTVPICRPPWERCIIHQRYHRTAEGWLTGWLKPRTHIVDITFTLASSMTTHFNIGLQLFISCDIHVERVAQEARQGALKPFLTDFSKYRLGKPWLR